MEETTKIDITPKSKDNDFTIDITPNWQTVARIYTAVMESNDKTTKQGRAAVVNAREDLIKMGNLLDKVIEQLNGDSDGRN